MPKLEAILRLTQPLIPGEEVRAVLELRAPQPVEVEWVDISMEGIARWHTGSGKSRRSRSEAFLRKNTRFTLNTTLSGESSYNVRFPMPLGVPPTFNHSNASVGYAMRATASIPWAFDPHWNWPLRVDGAPPVAEPPKPIILRTPHGLELSLEKQSFGRGEALRGRIAWPGQAGEVDVVVREVVDLMSAYSGIFTASTEPLVASQRHGRAFGVRVNLDPNAPGGSAFAFQLPEDLTVGFQQNVVRMRWELCVQTQEVGMLWNSRHDQLRAPITITTQASSHAEVAVAPPVGDARLLAILREVATELGWSASEEGISRDVALRGQTLSAHVMWQRRGQMVLSAEVSFPSVELGLRVSQSSLMQSMLGGDIELGDGAWDGKHWVEGREATQVRAFLTPIAQFAQQNQLNLVHADDNSLTFERIDSQVSAPSLHVFVSQLDRLLAILPQVMSQVPTSAHLVVDVPRALRMAEVLNGLFVPSVAGFHGTLPSGQPLTARVVFGASGMARTLEVRVGELAEGTLDVGLGRAVEGLSGPVQALVSMLDEDAHIEMAHGIGKATVLLTGATPEVSPERVLQLGQWLVSASRAMTESGAFR